MPQDKESIDTLENFRSNLPEFLDSFEKATENWPYPPGPEHRAAAAQYRQQQADFIKAGEKMRAKIRAKDKK